jgi:hypothetical protein
MNWLASENIYWKIEARRFDEILRRNARGDSSKTNTKNGEKKKFAFYFYLTFIPIEYANRWTSRINELCESRLHTLFTCWSILHD